MRYEQDELIVLAIDDELAELAELGRVEVGAAAWIATDQRLDPAGNSRRHRAA